VNAVFHVLGDLLRFQVLGSLRLWNGTAWTEIRAAQQRLVLAVLLAEAGQLVRTERLVDELWGERAPREALSTIRGYVMRLRRAIGEGADRIVLTRDSGYELVVADDDLDAARFERLASEGVRASGEGRSADADARLSHALALWRGPAMADVPDSRTVAAYAGRLERTRLTAVEERLAVRLRLGRYAEVIDEASRLVETYPLGEQWWMSLVAALHRSGHRSEALKAYGRARAVTVAELGLEPGPALRELQQAILADDVDSSTPPAVAVAVPAQLPPAVPGFTGRDAHLRRLDALLPGGPSPRPVVAIAGAAGIGKTATAVHWAHRTRHRFPDGQLYANLHGFGAGPPLRPIEVLTRFLTALGVATDRIPSGEDAAAGLYRSLLAGKRMLILLDDASDAGQLRPLLPAAAGCLVLVTSRDQLRGLVARDGAVVLTLGVLAAGEAVTLLNRLLGADRAAAEPDAVAELAEVCGYLPLALRIAAADLTARSHGTVVAHVRRLRAGDRLGLLQVDGDPHAGVRAAFDLSYAALPDPARRLFRLLGLVPGADIGTGGAAALAGVAPAVADHLLDRLVSAHLVEEHAPGRYTMHDLLRRYAGERASAEEPMADRQAAIGRLYDHYQHGVRIAADRLYPQVLRLPAPDLAGPAAGSEDDPLAWLDAERTNLVAAVRQAAAHGPRRVAWQLADALRGYLVLANHPSDLAVVADAGLAAAEAENQPQAAAAAHNSLGSLHFLQGEYARAVAHYEPALPLARRAGWLEGESALLGNLGSAYNVLGQPERAAEYITQALDIDRRVGRVGGQANNLSNLGLAHAQLGRLASACEHYAEALALYRQTGSRSGEARLLTNLADLYHWRGRFDEAMTALNRARTLHCEVGDRVGEAMTLRLLATVHGECGCDGEAYECVSAALAITREVDSRRSEADVLGAYGSLHQRFGRLSQALDCYRKACGLARELNERYLEAELLAGFAAAYNEAGRAEQAASHAAAALAIARQAGYRLLEGNVLTTLAAIHLRDGRPAQAVRDAEQALACHLETGNRLGATLAHDVARRALGRPSPTGRRRKVPPSGSTGPATPSTTVLASTVEGGDL
jgi:DNA-binding SARP family transcriptional activator